MFCVGKGVIFFHSKGFVFGWGGEGLIVLKEGGRGGGGVNFKIFI